MISVSMIVIGVILFLVGTGFFIQTRTPDNKEKIGNGIAVVLWMIAGVAILAGLGFLLSDRMGGPAPFVASSGNAAEEKWDRLTDDGKYKAADGSEYIYCILISGKEYEFNGEPCKDISEIKEKLSEIKKQNTVLIVDHYAVSSYYHDVEDLLKELGISYKYEENNVNDT